MIEVGDRFGRLTVAHVNGARVTVVCDCGSAQRVTQRWRLLSGHSTSCGCKWSEQATRMGHASAKHHMHGTPEYRAWRGLKYRCLNPNSGSYSRYGGRGITVCQEWADSFEAFYRDMGQRPPGTSIDRIDNQRGYEPGNCRWATPVQQTRNRELVIWFERNGVRKRLIEWCEELGINYYTAYGRIFKRGMSFEEAITRPIRKMPKRALAEMEPV